MAIPETRTYARPAAATLALVLGAWWIFDAIHAYVTGRYFGAEVGPWAAIPRAVGVDPIALAPAFLVLGVLWATASFGLVFKESWSRPLSVFLAAVSLPYLPVGTLIGLIVLVLLYGERTVPGGPEAEAADTE